MSMSTTELAEELELRRYRYFVSRLAYLRSHMAGTELTLLDYLTTGATPEQWEAFDRAIDRDVCSR